MTREEIVKALRCCNSETECRGCPFEEQEPLLGPCAEKVLSAAADLIEQDNHFADTGKMVPFTLDELDCLNVGVLGGVPIWIEHRSDKPDLLRREFSGWQVLQGLALLETSAHAGGNGECAVGGNNAMNRIICRWCGQEMNLADSADLSYVNGIEYCYECPACHAASPAAESPERANEQAMRRPDLFHEATKMTPIPFREIQGAMVVPCWIEIRNEFHPELHADVLDQNGLGYFGRISGYERVNLRGMRPEDYGKTWRCWPRYPSSQECRETKWED